MCDSDLDQFQYFGYKQPNFYIVIGDNFPAIILRECSLWLLLEFSCNTLVLFLRHSLTYQSRAALDCGIILPTSIVQTGVPLIQIIWGLSNCGLHLKQGIDSIKMLSIEHSVTQTILLPFLNTSKTTRWYLLRSQIMTSISYLQFKKWTLTLGF